MCVFCACYLENFMCVFYLRINSLSIRKSIAEIINSFLLLHEGKLPARPKKQVFDISGIT